MGKGLPLGPAESIRQRVFPLRWCGCSYSTPHQSSWNQRLTASVVDWVKRVVVRSRGVGVRNSSKWLHAMMMPYIRCPLPAEARVMRVQAAGPCSLGAGNQSTAISLLQKLDIPILPLDRLNSRAQPSIHITFFYFFIFILSNYRFC